MIRTRLTAIEDFTFNLGGGRLQTSALRRKVNQRDWIAAASEQGRWVYGGTGCSPDWSRGEPQNVCSYSGKTDVKRSRNVTLLRSPSAVGRVN
ncbi:glycoside hydrolase family protein [Methylococcus mesophilus]|uniref:glycoside hydrolase family protein n=1 Tax=Methylococcus mesophilus TaxID=2993564 RepID=UPI003742DFA9